MKKDSRNLRKSALKAYFFTAALLAAGLAGWAGCSKSSNSTPTPTCDRACTMTELKGNWSITNSVNSANDPNYVWTNGTVMTIGSGSTDSTMTLTDPSGYILNIVVTPGAFTFAKQATPFPGFPYTQGTGNLGTATSLTINYYWSQTNSTSTFNIVNTLKKN